MGKTSIEWTQVTWNPTVGCDRISPGCARCYAKDLHDRRHKAFLAGKDMPRQYAQPFEVLQMFEDRLDAPLRRRIPTTYFVNSVSDLFHEDVPDAFIDKVFAVMALARQHTFQILTKRAERLGDYMSKRPPGVMFSGTTWHWTTYVAFDYPELQPWPLSNVWLGVSVENQHFADERIPLLLKTPAAVRFISAEPLLESILLDNGDFSWLSCASSLTCEEYEAMTPSQQGEHHCCYSWDAGGHHYHGIDWVIVGGESGAGARPCDVAWARSIVAQCQAAGVPVFVKQLGADPRAQAGVDFSLERHDNGFPVHESRAVRANGGMMLRDRKGGDMAEWPEDLRIREFPKLSGDKL